MTTPNGTREHTIGAIIRAAACDLAEHGVIYTDAEFVAQHFASLYEPSECCEHDSGDDRFGAGSPTCGHCLPRFRVEIRAHDGNGNASLWLIRRRV